MWRGEVRRGVRATTYRSGEVALSLPVAVDVVTGEVADSAAVHVDVVWSSVVGVGVRWGGNRIRIGDGTYRRR